MSTNPSKVVILDPGRAFGSQEERSFSDHVALDFHRAGWQVDWHVDADDGLDPRPYARLWRTLRSAPMAEGLAPAADPEPPLADDVALGNLPAQADHAPSGPTPAEVKPVSRETGRPTGFAALGKQREGFRVAALDRWARTAWRRPGIGPITRLAALFVWALIRAYFRTCRLAGVIRWNIGESYRSAVRAVYWAGIFPYAVEPAGNFCKALYWKLWHPVAGFLARSVRFVYWRGLYACVIVPARPAVRWSCRTLIDPITYPLRRLARHVRRVRKDAVEWFEKRFLAAASNGKSDADEARAGSDGDARAFTVPVEPHVENRHELFHVFAGWLKHELDHGRPPSLIILPCAEPSHFEALLAIVPILGIDRPLDVPVVACIADRQRILDSPGIADCGTLSRRLASGSPFSHIFMVDRSADDGQRQWHGLPVAPLGDPQASRNPVTSNSVAAIASAFVSTAEKCIAGNASTIPPSLLLTAFGPLAIVSSALWGRVGSSTIFDAQVRALVEEGYRVARFYFDHWPHYGADRLPRIARMVAGDQQNVRSHYQVVLERDESGRRISRLHASEEFLKASPVMRMCLILADTVTTDEPAATFLGRHADIVIVNHLPHLEATRQFTKAPVILETHDVFSSLLDVHGIPGFVPTGSDSEEMRLAEEKEAWASVDFCINLSPEDHAAISPYARDSAYIRPYRDRTVPSRRSWPEVAHANGIPDDWLAPGYFDIMLWGSWHENNVQSVKWFLDEVCPLLNRRPDARIIVAGRVVEGLGPYIRSRPDILFCKFVDTLEDVASRSRVLVIPDQSGTGICIKAMDALAWGRPFAATRYGMRGTDFIGADYTPATDAQALADDIAKLLDSEAERRKRQELGSLLFERNYSRRTYQGAFSAVLTKVTGANARVSAAEMPPEAAETVPGEAVGGNWSGLPALSVVVATYDRYDVLPDAIASLRHQNVPCGFLEIIVVDNSPDQARAARTAEYYADVEGLRYILEPTPGLSNARNVGTEAARGEIVAFIDDDAIADREWAREIIEAFSTAGDCAGIVGGPIHPRWVTPQPKWLPNELTSHLSIVDWGGDLRQLEPDKWVAGCNIAFRKSALREVGGFSRALGRIGPGLALLSNDETEVAAKIHALGYATFYAPRAGVDHVIDPARLKRQWFRRRAAWQAVSDFISDADVASRRLTEAVDHVRWAATHRKSPAPLGFYGVTEDSEGFQQDAGLAYDYVKVVLAGGVGLADVRRVQAEKKGVGKLNGATATLPPLTEGMNARPRRRKRQPAAEKRGGEPGPAISVIIATYNRHAVLGEAVLSLLDQDIAERDLEIVIVDNSPNQEEAASFARRYDGEPRVSYLLEPRPGLSNARNVGVAHARGEIVAFVDDDAIAAPDWARWILAVFQGADREVAVVGGRILPRWVQPKPDWLADSLLGYLSIVDWPGNGLRPLESDEWIAGCNMAFVRADLLRAGGFSAALGRIGSQAALLSNDDTEVIERVKALGKTVLYEPRALVEHVIDPERLSRQWFRRRSAWQAASDFIKDSKEASRYAEVAARRLFDETSALSDVPGLGFFVETDDPGEFARQVGIMYDLTITSLVGGEEIDAAGHLVMSGGICRIVETRVKAKIRAVARPGSRIRRLARSIRRA